VQPEPYSFVADVDAALVRQVLDIAERKWKANLHHNRQADHLRAAVKILEGVTFCHGWTLRNRLAPLKAIPSDKTKEQDSRDSAEIEDGCHGLSFP
jgi:hypothetical protein